MDVTDIRKIANHKQCIIVEREVMYWLTFALLILSPPLSNGMAPQQQSTSTLSGIFSVYDPTGDFSFSHGCLVRSLGIMRIHLVGINGTTRSYWVEGYADMTKDFIFHCISRDKCYIHQVLPNYVDITSNGGRQQCMQEIDLNPAMSLKNISSTELKS